MLRTYELARRPQHDRNRPETHKRMSQLHIHSDNFRRTLDAV